MDWEIRQEDVWYILQSTTQSVRTRDIDSLISVSKVHKSFIRYPSVRIFCSAKLFWMVAQTHFVLDLDCVFKDNDFFFTLSSRVTLFSVDSCQIGVVIFTSTAVVFASFVYTLFAKCGNIYRPSGASQVVRKILPVSYLLTAEQLSLKIWLYSAFIVKLNP